MIWATQNMITDVFPAWQAIRLFSWHVMVVPYSVVSRLLVWPWWSVKLATAVTGLHCFRFLWVTWKTWCMKAKCKMQAREELHNQGFGDTRCENVSDILRKVKVILNFRCTLLHDWESGPCSYDIFDWNLPQENLKYWHKITGLLCNTEYNALRVLCGLFASWSVWGQVFLLYVMCNILYLQKIASFPLVGFKIRGLSWKS